MKLSKHDQEIAGNVAKDVLVPLGAGAMMTALNNHDPIVALQGVALVGLLKTGVSSFLKKNGDSLIQSVVDGLAAVKDEVAKIRGQQRLITPEGEELLAQAFLVALPSSSEERINQLANVVVNGLIDEEFEVSSTKKILGLVAQLDEVEVIILYDYGLGIRNEEEIYREKHSTIFKYKSPYSEEAVTIHYKYPSNVPPEEWRRKRLLEIEHPARHTMFKAREHHLLSLGLIEGNVQDEVSTEYKITPMGLMILYKIEERV